MCGGVGGNFFISSLDGDATFSITYLRPHCGLNIVELAVPLLWIGFRSFNPPTRGSLNHPDAGASIALTAGPSIAPTANVSIAPTAGEKEEEGKSYLLSITLGNARSPQNKMDVLPALVGTRRDCRECSDLGVLWGHRAMRTSWRLVRVGTDF